MTERQPPPQISDEGILVGWSLEHERGPRPIGFTNGSNDLDRSKYLEPILYRGSGHLVSVAPTGAGKGTGCIVPTLLRHRGQAIVVDPKGENYAVTARRRRELGHRVVLLDPFRITNGENRDTLNPLDLIDKDSPFRLDDVAVLAELIVQRTPDHRDPFWEDRAEDLITALLLHILLEAPPAIANLGELHYLLTQPRKAFRHQMETLAKSGDADLRRMAGILPWDAERVAASIISVTQSQVDFLRGQTVQGVLERSTFSLNDLKEGHLMTIYLVMPPERLESHGRLLRLWIGTLMTVLLRRSSPPAERTLFILDEASQLGTLRQLRQAITLLRGYGLQTWSFWQDLSQLRQLYPRDWETMYNNCRVHQHFGLTNMHAVRTACEMTGYPDEYEILDLDGDEMMLGLSGDLAVIAQRPNYLTDSIFNGQYDANPFHPAGDEEEAQAHRPQRTFRRPFAAEVPAQVTPPFYRK